MHEKSERSFSNSCKLRYGVVALLVVAGLFRYVQDWSGSLGSAYRFFLGPMAHVFVTDTRLNPMKLVITFKDSTKEISLDAGSVKSYRPGFFARHALVGVFNAKNALLFPGVRSWAHRTLCGPSDFQAQIYGEALPLKVGVWTRFGEEESFKPYWELTCSQEAGL